MTKDWSKDFDNKLKKKFGTDVIRLEPYVNKCTTIRFKHKCGNIYRAVPRGVLKSKVGSCTKCRRKGIGFRQRTNEQFIKEVYKLVGDEYTFLDEYIKALDKIRCRHNKCGTVWKVKPNTFLCGSRCPNIDCIPKKPYKTQEQIVEEVRGKTNGEYVLVDRYQGDGTKILFQHVKCGYKWKIKPNDILNGHGCPQCTNHIQWTTEDYKKFLKLTYGDEYSLLSKYKTMLDCVKVRHKKCGRVYWTEAATLKSGHGCKLCAAKAQGIKSRLNPDEFNKRVLDLLGLDYEVTGYVRREDPVNAYHKKCGHRWRPKASNLLSGSGCPFCKQSRGERTIANWLKSNSIAHIPQKKFKDCKDINQLPFDFYIPSYNLIIEYDGRQHFSGSDDYFGGEKAYKIRHKHDLIKNKYCADNNINLLRIPYTVKGDDIGKTIQAKLSELNNGAPEQLSLNLDEVA